MIIHFKEFVASTNTSITSFRVAFKRVLVELNEWLKQHPYAKIIEIKWEKERFISKNVTRADEHRYVAEIEIMYTEPNSTEGKYNET